MTWARVGVCTVLLIYSLVSGGHLPSPKLHLFFLQSL